MKTIGSSQLPSTFTLASFPAVKPQWQVGQRLDAVVLAQTSRNRLALNIGTAILDAHSSLDVTVGQRLPLEVLQIDNQIILRLIAKPTETDVMTAAGHSGSTRVGTLLTLSNPPPSAVQWQVGQRLNAIVVSPVSQDRVALQIGNSLLDFRGSLTTDVGQRLTLEVVQTGDQMVLRTLPSASQADPVMASLRTTLPQQLPLQLVFTRFSEILASNLGLPPAVAALLKQLLQQLPSDQTVTDAGKLKQSLLESGQFLEHQLGSNAETTSLNKDIKANLLRLLAELVQTETDNTAELNRHVGAALARIQFHQLSALLQEHTQAVWAGELPIRRGDQVDVLRFHIEKDTVQAADTSSTNWCTWLSLNFHALGPIHAKIALSNQDISTTFWAESNATTHLVKEHLPYLQQALKRVGLGVKNIQCHHGRPPIPIPDRIPNGLLDIIA